MLPPLPTLQHPELNALFKHGLEIPDTVLAPILALPRESLIADLEGLIRWAMPLDPEELGEEFSWFFFHALMLLAELRAEESLPLLLEVLRLPDRDMDWWFGDFPLEDFWGIFLWCGQQRVADLVDFIKDPSVPDDFIRCMVVDVLEQIGFHFPERRDEMVKTLGDLLAYFNQLEPFENADLNTVTCVTDSLASLEAREYLPAIQALFEKNRVDEFVRGNWKMFQEEFGDRYSSKHPLWHSYREWLDTRGAGWRRMIEQNERSAQEAELRRLERELAATKETVRQTQRKVQEHLLPRYQKAGGGSKIGRNDPCPCGSGKKYKKCCGA